MSFLAKMKSLAGAAGSTLAGEVSKIRDKKQCEATLAMMALIAGADGEIEAEERKAGANFVRNGDLFKAFDRQQLATALEGYYAKATCDISKQDLYDQIAKFKGTDTARTLVKIGLGIAGSDGEVEPGEVEVLRECCTILGLNAGEFKQLA